mmetsp:Transcript_82335/g.150675  ORF Transcript_82335/g.150675 Transcript_82335/m.150675 type:complete len:199 (+) Transcript_82335:111-707(+)
MLKVQILAVLILGSCTASPVQVNSAGDVQELDDVSLLQTADKVATHRGHKTHEHELAAEDSAAARPEAIVKTVEEKMRWKKQKLHARKEWARWAKKAEPTWGQAEWLKAIHETLSQAPSTYLMGKPQLTVEKVRELLREEGTAGNHQALQHPTGKRKPRSNPWDNTILGTLVSEPWRLDLLSQQVMRRWTPKTGSAAP